MTDKPDTSPAALRALADDPRSRRSSASEMEWLFDMRRTLRALAGEKESWEREAALNSSGVTIDKWRLRAEKTEAERDAFKARVAELEGRLSVSRHAPWKLP